MATVTGRIGEIKQPRGGYLKPSSFSEIRFDDGQNLSEENIGANTIGMAVEYLTRFMMGESVENAFAVSIEGYCVWSTSPLKKNSRKMKPFLMENLLPEIQGLDDKSILAACRAVTYDVWCRNPGEAIWANGADKMNPDAATINNIRVMVNRSMEFWKHYGPIVKTGFQFEPSGYSQTVTDGEGDFLTHDTMWDFKVSKSKPKTIHTLQLLMYWIMGQHSGQEEYRSISKLGFFNPRLNSAFILDVASIPKETIKAVEDEVICYSAKL